MGLDMYLESYPRYEGYGPDDFNCVANYVEYNSDEEAKAKWTFEEYTGRTLCSLPPKADLDYISNNFVKKDKLFYSASIEEIYWRKANAIHAWFVDNVQDGEDDCEFHREVTKEDLAELRDACANVLEHAVLVKSNKVKNGYRLGENGEMVPNYCEGFVVANPDVCEEYLPTRDGFFFGMIDFDESYINYVRYTYEKVCSLLERFDFDSRMLYYCSSW